MGLGDFFGKWVVCPFCRHKGARNVLGFIKCPNMKCEKYDPQVQPPPSTLLKPSGPSKTFTGNFDPGQNRITVFYRNFLGDDRTYEADKTTFTTKGEYVSARVVPTGRRITFKKRFIRNLNEIENCINEIIIKELGNEQEAKVIKVKYKNFEGKDLVFDGYIGSIKAERESIIIRVSPSGKKFFLKKANIQNLSELEPYIK